MLASEGGEGDREPLRKMEGVVPASVGVGLQVKRKLEER